MPKAEFFTRLGLFVESHFLTLDQCAALQASIQAAEPLLAEVISTGGKETVNQAVRKALYVHIPSPLQVMLTEQLLQLLPRLQEHFGLPLQGFQPPQYLHYRAGDFFQPHRDGSSETHPHAAYLEVRKISVVIFLNAHAPSPAPNCFGGGELTFYGLVNEPRWQQYGFSLEGEPGLLVAFRSDLLHEVCPVTWGDRYTIVAWFY
ncbi:MAG: 2OG-Fe(II) oxygenase [Cyanobacteria bacterium]|nr:2OG-Fe(II) oxygenase [Cyanobacteriota bacterium]MDW8202455.1 2OG-Fe(II) oxygenase [Cyanobacteriota bacterium SKYGB_h_bin112]